MGVKVVDHGESWHDLSIIPEFFDSPRTAIDLDDASHSSPSETRFARAWYIMTSLYAQGTLHVSNNILIIDPLTNCESAIPGSDLSAI